MRVDAQRHGWAGVAKPGAATVQLLLAATRNGEPASPGPGHRGRPSPGSDGGTGNSFTADLCGIDAQMRDTKKKLTVAIRAAGTGLTGLSGSAR
jgi:hypothetical protein